MSLTNAESFKLKRVRVKIIRTIPLTMSDGETREQIIMKRCAVHIERCNLQQFANLNQSVCDTLNTRVNGVRDHLYNGHKLKRLCVRVPRISFGECNDITSRSASAITNE